MVHLRPLASTAVRSDRYAVRYSATSDLLLAKYIRVVGAVVDLGRQRSSRRPQTVSVGSSCGQDGGQGRLPQARTLSSAS